MPTGSLAFCPKVIYGPASTVLAFTYPPVPPEPGSQAVGGSDTSGAGVVAAFEIRRDQTLNVTLRFTEREHGAVLAWLEYAQRGNAFTFYMDQHDPLSAHTCYLVTPKQGDEIRPTRDSAQIALFTLDVQLRDTAGVRFLYPITAL